MKKAGRRRRILIIYTGGTFGMDPTPLKIPTLSPAILKRRLLDHVPELDGLAKCEVQVAFNRDSAHLGPAEWVALADRIRKQWKNYDGVVLLHGTDTLAYTASALSFLLRPCLKPVVITGAQRPLAALRTDARRNLVSAVEIAAHGPHEVVRQVTVFFDDQLLQGNRARKRSATEFAAFESPKAPPLAVVGTQIQYLDAQAGRGLKRAKRMPALKPRFSGRLACLQVTPGFPAKLISESLLPGLDALILVVFPSGTAPSHDADFIQFLRSAKKAGKSLILVTEGTGVCQGSAYRAGKKLLEEGCLWAGEMTPESAYVKASLLLAQAPNARAFKRLWNLDLAGES